MKRWMIFTMIGLLLVVTLACGGTDGDRRSGDPDGLQIQVINNSPYDICYVYISSSSASNWGEDQLGGDDVISAGARQSFNMAQETYDIRLENCDQAAVATEWEVASNRTVTVGLGNNSSALLVVNESSTDVCFVFISPLTASDWGEDQLGGKESLVSGARRVFYINPGTYDLMAADCEQQTLAEQFDVDISDDLTWTLYDD